MRDRIAKLVIVLLLGIGASCATVQHLDPIPDEPTPMATTADDPIRIVAVRPPELRYEDPVDGGLDDEIEESAHLIRVLRKTGLFEEVDYTGQVGCPIDIEITAVRGEYPRLTEGPFWLNVVTLSAAVIDTREGVSFHPSDAPEEQIDLPYETRLYVGIVPLLASPVLATGLLSSWEFFWAGPSTGESLRAMVQAELAGLDGHRGNAGEECGGPEGRGSGR